MVLKQECNFRKIFVGPIVPMLFGRHKKRLHFHDGTASSKPKTKRTEKATGCPSTEWQWQGINKSIPFSFHFLNRVRHGFFANVFLGKGKRRRGRSEEGENHVGNLSFDRLKYMAFFFQKRLCRRSKHASFAVGNCTVVEGVFKYRN